jgi:hypothetical protein
LVAEAHPDKKRTAMREKEAKALMAVNARFIFGR